MGPETIHFLECCLRDKPPMVDPMHARMVMETYSAADLSADRNEPVNLPLSNAALADLAELQAAMRTPPG
jgi:myo-inositol 2-dehydrogenase/D-chiro-inositol 1-dehydrogenase